MNLPRPAHCLLAFAAALLLRPVVPARAAEARPAPDMPFIGGVGGVYLLAEPGELVIEIEKKDLNRRDVRTELRAILAGPDREVLQEATIADDGLPRGRTPGPVQTCRLTARVLRRGVYALNVTVSQDRYGEEMVWRFRTNCARYLVETARGHRDARHEEPIVLAQPGKTGAVVFQPRTGAFRVELSRLPADGGEIRLVDSLGTPVASLRADSHGQAIHEMPAARSRPNPPWRLEFPSAQATVQIDGVTRWQEGDALPDHCLWTPQASSWFPFAENRWLLTPYRRQIFGAPGRTVAMEFQVRNEATRPREIRLGLEFPGDAWDVTLPATSLRLAPRESRPVRVRAAVPAAGSSRVVHIRATPADDSSSSTYATLVVTAGEAPATRPLSLPLQLRAYRHENEQFGHLPDFPVENQLYFDPHHRPFVRTATGIATLRQGRWESTSLPGKTSPASSKLTFDREGRVYVLANRDGGTELHVSADGGRTFVATPLPRRERPPRAFELEEFTGHNPLDGPPPILRYTQTAKDEKLFWRSLNDLELFLPRFEQGRLIIGEPIHVTRQCIGLASHSGIPSSVVSRGDQVHVIWGEATDPAEKVPGVPACIATFDRSRSRLSERTVLGYGAPANDIHNSPSLTMDGPGFLHALGGTHGKPFPYAASLQPNNSAAGWSPAVPTGENTNQTYIGLVCGPDGTLHAVFRLWRYQTAPFPLSTHATLAYQRKPPGRPWEAPRVLVAAPFSEYSVFYHRLTIDRRGRLFVAYDYWSTFWFYRNDLPGRRRTVMLSPDGGDTWKLAVTADLE